MPELPDITIYVERLEALVQHQKLLGVRLASPFVLRTVTPSPTEFVGRTVEEVGRVGKRIVLRFADDFFAVLHLMIAGRLRWKKPGAKLPGKLALVAFDFDAGTLMFTEASPKKRASLHLLQGAAALDDFDRGGINVQTATVAAFAERLRQSNHTIKRALTDPTIVDGIGNAYSDEILHHAGLSPFKQTGSMSDAELAAVHCSSLAVLEIFTERLRTEVGNGFPDKVTAFRPDMAVHGRFGKPCPGCQSPIQRIAYADKEANYCATCQTGGRLLADRSLSRLLKDDWPKTLAELEERRRDSSKPP